MIEKPAECRTKKIVINVHGGFERPEGIPVTKWGAEIYQEDKLVESCPHIHQAEFDAMSCGLLRKEAVLQAGGYQNESRTYLPWERQLDCRIDGRPEPGGARRNMLEGVL
jgi:hypothetical protein